MADEPAAVPTPSPAAEPVVTPVVDPAAPVVAAEPAKVEPVAAESAKPVVPEKYDFKAPEGMELNQPLLDAVSPVFKEMGLSQEQAGKLFETYNKVVVAEEAKREADFTDFMKQKVTEYNTTIRKEWGAQYDVNLATAQRGLARVMSPEAKAILDETGLGSHPEFVKAFYAVGKMVSEDTLPIAGAPGGKKSNAEVFYGATN